MGQQSTAEVVTTALTSHGCAGADGVWTTLGVDRRNAPSCRRALGGSGADSAATRRMQPAGRTARRRCERTRAGPSGGCGARPALRPRRICPARSRCGRLGRRPVWWPVDMCLGGRRVGAVRPRARTTRPYRDQEPSSRACRACRAAPWPCRPLRRATTASKRAGLRRAGAALYGSDGRSGHRRQRSRRPVASPSPSSTRGSASLA